MFSVADHSTGIRFSLEMPWPLGPRNRVQFSAFAKPDVNEINTKLNRKQVETFIGESSGV